MQVSRVTLCSTVLAVATACAAFRLEPPASPGTPKLEFQDARFDGKDLHGRILVGAVGGPVILDGRLIAHSTVTVENVLDCLTNEAGCVEQGAMETLGGLLPARRAARLSVLDAIQA